MIQYGEYDGFVFTTFIMEVIQPMILSKKACGISESLTLSIDAKAKKMKSEGYDVVGFGAGEPDFPTPDFIVQGGIG